VLVALVATSGPQRARGDVFDGVDLSVGTGVSEGTVVQEQPDGKVNTFTIGGIPFAAMLNRDLAEHWSGHLDLSAMLDVVNQQMIRQGFAGTLDYHVLGGARRIAHPGDTVSTTSTSHQSLSVAVRGGIFNYAAANKKDPNVTLSGGVWELAGGLEYRRDVSERSAFGGAFMTTITTLPSSVQRLSTRTTEVLGFWRVYL
jgi:hypothetical protein